MKKNRYSKIGKTISLVILLSLTFFILAKISQHYLLTSKLFKVKTIIYTGALKSLRLNGLPEVKGQNLFSVNIRHLEKDIKLSYPYLTGVRVSRMLPDKIWFDAQERIAIAKVRLADRLFLCDREGAILPANNPAINLVLITGVDSRLDKVRIGEIYDSLKLKAAVGLLKEIEASRVLAITAVTRIDVSLPEEIVFFLNNGIRVIIGNEHISDRLKLLNLVINNLKAEINKIDYIDLRFQEPAIGKR